MADLNMTQPAMPDGIEKDPNAPIDAKPEDPQEKLKTDIEKHLKSQVEQAERDIDTNKKSMWKRNIELRQGNPNGGYMSFTEDAANDDYQSEYNPDWFLTKTKMAALFSQVPKVTLTHEAPQYLPAVGPFGKAINYELGKKRCNTGAAMTEISADIVNAAGIGAIVVGYAARFGTKEIPALDTKMMPPEMVQQMIATKQMPMKEVPTVEDYQFFTRRISPLDLLKPKTFTGSDFNEAPWIGERFRTSWAEAKSDPNWKLTDEDREEIIQSADAQKSDNSLKTNADGGDSALNLKEIKGKRIYYWRYRADPDCKSFTEIWEIVWLDGKTDPVYHDKWKGQKYNEQTKKYIGSCKFPIQVGTTTYITDNPEPPSDSQAGRPQVNDLRRSRSQMFQNRAFSTPLRWFNTDKTDPLMHDLLMKGQIQGMVPVQGDGTKMIGEVARASYPAEDHSFDQIAEGDLYKTWMLGPNQMGMLASHETTAGEAKIAQGGASSVMGYERGRIADMFLGVVEVLAGLMALYSDFPMLTQQERQVMMQAWDDKAILHDLAFDILPDSQVVLDTAQQIQKTSQLLNLTAKSGFINTKLLIVKLVELHGFDPNELVVDPQPHPMKPAGVSFSFRGKDDLQNPMVLAILAKNQQMPSPQEVAAAQQALLQIQSGQIIQPPQPGMPGPGGGPKPLPPPNQDHAPQWGLANKVAKRSRDMSGGGR